MGAKDAGGMTRIQVEMLSLEERFDLVGERYARVQELMTPAQEHISTGPWAWGTGGAAFPRGVSSFDLLSGATEESSYHLEMVRATVLEGAVGEKKDAEKMASYFESQGWDTKRSFIQDEELDYQRYEVVAHTKDGYWLEYQVQENGQYNLSVFSGTFWAGNYDELQEEVIYRIPKDGFFPYGEESVPGKYVKFPKWSDPKLWTVDSE